MKFEENEKPIYNVAEVAEQLQITRWTVRRWANEGKLGSTKYGSQFRFSEKDIQEFVARSRNEHVAQEAVAV